jgi:FAD:protein FMN transferase
VAAGYIRAVDCDETSFLDDRYLLVKQLIQTQVSPVLGTVMHVHSSVECSRFVKRKKLREHIETTVLVEIDRLAKVFSVYDEHSELRRWRTHAIRGWKGTVSVDLAALLQLSASLQSESNGAYNPAIGAVFDCWKAAEATGIVPSIQQTAEWANQLEHVPYVVNGDTVHCVADCTGLTFNSLAKGLIADRALGVLMALKNKPCQSVSGGIVNLGGDLAIRDYPMHVAIEHPTRPYDNEPPLRMMEVTNGGVATSGASRRPIVIAGQTFSHIIDPRTCRPVDRIGESVTVIAEDAATADVMATVISVTGEIPPGIRALIAQADGSVVTSEDFEQDFRVTKSTN